MLLGLAAPVLALLRVTVPPVAMTRPVIGATGLLVALGGLVVVLVAQGRMGASWRIGVDPAERTGLVTTGLFAWIRNPIFTGLVGIAAGAALMVPTAVSVAAVALPSRQRSAATDGSPC